MPKVEKNKEEQVKTVDISGKQYAEQREKALSRFDTLKMYLRKPYKVNDRITIYQPTLGQIIEFGDQGQYGEKEFYSTVNIFVSNPTSYRLQLWDVGIDWNKITDYELFCMLVGGVQPDVQKILFGDNVDFRGLKRYVVQKKSDDENQTFLLYDPESELEVDEETYTTIALYMRAMFNIFPKVEKAKGKTTKEWIIEEERDKLRHQKHDTSSMLLPLISACVNHPGFKYKLDELGQIGIVEFMDAVQRLQIYENTRALLTGSMSGMVDTKGVPKEEFNFMRSLNNI